MLATVPNEHVPSQAYVVDKFFAPPSQRAFADSFEGWDSSGSGPYPRVRYDSSFSNTWDW